MIVKVSSGNKVNICFKELRKGDIRNYGLYKKNGWFKWGDVFASRENKLFGMFIAGNNEIQGIIAIQEHWENQLIHIELMETAPQNKSSNPNQVYAGIGKNLLCFAIDLSFQCNYDGYIGLFAKKNKNEEYYRKLGAIQSMYSIPPYYYFPTDKSAKLIKNYLPGGVRWCHG